MKKVLLLTLLAAGFATQVKGAAAVADDDSNWCASANIGHAWSMKSSPSFKASEFAVIQTTESADQKLGKSSVVGLSLNRNLWSWLSAGVSYDIYSGFRYDSYHIPGSAEGTVEVVGTTNSFRRSFNLSHQSAMLNINVMLPEDWAVNMGGLNVSPVLGGGIGFGISEMSNFQTVGKAGALSLVSGPNSKASLAYCAHGGLNFQPEDSNMSFGVNYRYYYGGKFESAAKYQLISLTTTETAGTAWSGKLKTHQVRLNLNFEF